MSILIWMGANGQAAGALGETAKPFDWSLPPEGWADDMVEFGPWDDAECPQGLPGECVAAETGHVGDMPQMFVFGAVSSALDVCRELAAAGALNVWDAVVAASQWSGRGQLRRGWHSPEGNMYVGWRIPPLEGPGEDLASIAVGVALAEAFAHLGVELELKWPNDLVLMKCPEDESGWGLKIGGVLLEERGGMLVAGIGINLHQAPPEEAMRDDHAVPAGCLIRKAPTGQRRAGPLAIWLSVARKAQSIYEELATKSAAEVVERAESRLAWKNRTVLVRQETVPAGQEDFDKCTGTIVGLTVHGAIRIAFDDGEKTFSSAQLIPLAP